MNLETHSRFGHTSWVADDGGIHELRDGRDVKHIPWNELERVTGHTLKGMRATINLSLPREEISELLKGILAAWKERQRDKWLRNQRRNHGIVKLLTFIIMPGLFLGPVAALLVLAWLKGADLPADMTNRMLRIILVMSLFVAWLWFLYFTKIRKAFAEPEPGEVRATSSRPSG